jgi:REP element-mobilizing transposase RayT
MRRDRADDGLLDGRPAAYFLTYTAYGTRLHGDPRGTVDKWHALPGSPLLEANPPRVERERGRMRFPPMYFDTPHRNAIELAIREVAAVREWELKALNVRTNHVHAVVAADAIPERVMNDFKVWATKRMRESGIAAPEGKIWSRHGSTIWLWTQRDLAAACSYVLDGQGDDLPGKPDW